MRCSCVWRSTHARHFHHPTQARFARSAHEQCRGQIMQEDASYPQWHSEIKTFFRELPIIEVGQVGMMKNFVYLCVLGPLKFQLMMMTVTRILTVFIINVKSRYLAIRGNTSDVGGRIFDTSSRNTTSDSKMLIPKVT